MKSYLKYSGNMTEEVKQFCGEDNIVSEFNNLWCIGYFLHEKNKSSQYMFKTGMYIIKDSNNISLSFEKPIED